ncbi:hypothetical protein ACQP1W_45840 [Spirillospora sp. CA-255316]
MTETGTPPQAPAASGLRRFGASLGVVVGPTTLLTALLYYFGWYHAYWFFNYFGLHSTALGLTTTDYLMRSLDALFAPLTVTACAALVAFWGHAELRARLPDGPRPRLLRVLHAGMAVAGLVLASSGLVSAFTTTPLTRFLVVPPLALGTGVLLLAYANHLYRRPEGPAAVVEWIVVFTLVSLSLFWAAQLYSSAVGEGRARRYVANLSGYPDVVIYSEKSLRITAPGVREVRCAEPAAAYRFRYDGLKLVIRSGDQYVFLPRAWTRRNGTAILLPRASSFRLEFLPTTSRGTVPPPAC